MMLSLSLNYFSIVRILEYSKEILSSTKCTLIERKQSSPNGSLIERSRISMKDVP